MLPTRKTGHNVLHLIYPIRLKERDKKISSFFTEDTGWKPLFQKHVDGTFVEPDFRQYFASFYKQMQQGTYRDIIPTKNVVQYFHPSVQDMLFHLENRQGNTDEVRGLRAFYSTERPQQFEMKFSKRENEPPLLFEWLASEVYTFNEELGFLVARISLKEYYSDRQTFQYIALEDYMRFANRIRQNYAKYNGQPHLKMTSLATGTTATFFVDYVRRLLERTSDKLQLSNVELDQEIKKDKEYYIEPNAFLHAFVKTDLHRVGDLTESELYQFIHVDDYEGESGGTKDFRKQFVEQNVYRRWENLHTYYTAIDYGAFTITDSQQNHYTDVIAYDTKGEECAFNDLFIQHHCRHYLLFIVLQQHYRETLQEIQGRYARLDGIKNHEAKAIAESFYNLNQTLYFQRITQEIQGRELWRFYSRIFELDELMKSAQHDIQELTARNIEASNTSQSANLLNLSVITLLTGLMGMNVFIPIFDGGREWIDGWLSVDSVFRNLFSWSFIYCVGFIVGIGIVLYMLWVLSKIKSKSK